MVAYAKMETISEFHTEPLTSLIRMELLDIPQSMIFQLEETLTNTLDSSRHSNMLMFMVKFVLQTGNQERRL